MKKGSRLKQPVLLVWEDAATFGLALGDREWSCQGITEATDVKRHQPLPACVSAALNQNSEQMLLWQTSTHGW